MREWSFLTNHAQAVLLIAHQPDVRMRDLADALEVTERTAYGIVADLTAAGYVVKSATAAATGTTSRTTCPCAPPPLAPAPWASSSTCSSRSRPTSTIRPERPTKPEMRDPMSESMARRLFQLVEPVAVVAYMADEPTDALMALGPLTMWDAYFAGTAAPLCAKRRPPWLTRCSTTSSTARSPATSRGCGTWSSPRAPSPRPNRAPSPRCGGSLGDLADTPGVARSADLLSKAGISAPTEGRALYAAVRTLPLPTEPVARLWHGANLLREHRIDGHGGRRFCGDYGSPLVMLDNPRIIESDRVTHLVYAVRGNLNAALKSNADLDAAFRDTATETS